MSVAATVSRTTKDTHRRASERAKSRDQLIPDIADPARRKQLEADDPAWLAYYFPSVFYNPFTDEQLSSIADIHDVLKFGRKKAKADQRGGGKSSIITYLTLKYALDRTVRFPLIIAATFGKGNQMGRNIRKRLASREPTSRELSSLGKRGVDTSGITPNLLADDYPLECFTARYVDPWPSRARNVTGKDKSETFDQRAIHCEWGADHLILPTWEDEGRMGAIIKSIGWSSDELQGCNVYDTRPDVLILDDLDSRDSLASEAGKIADKIEEVIEKTLSGMKGQSRRLGMYFLCTITSEASAPARYTDPQKKPAWSGVRVRAITKWPDCFDPEGKNPGLWDQYIHLRQKGMQEKDEFGRIAHQFYLSNRNAMDVGAELSNPYNYEADLLPDGLPKQVSALQSCFDYIADTSLESFNTEYQNDPPKESSLFKVNVSPYIVSTCASDLPRQQVDPTTSMIVRGVDVRKIELHEVAMCVDDLANNRIVDYRERGHGTSSNTVEQAETLILEGLYAMAADWDDSPLFDVHGTQMSTDLTLVDKGWMGSWKTEDGALKTWATQPVEQFCMEMGLRHFLPAKGAPNYRSPAPAKDCVIGDNWHMNFGPGKERVCTEVIWSAAHWHMLVEELFLLDDDDADRFVLFDPEEEGGYYVNHKRFGEHMLAGATEMKESMKRGTQSRKPRFVKDHWWDSCAMMLVAKSVESYIRQFERQEPVEVEAYRPPQSTPEFAGRRW